VAVAVTATVALTFLALVTRFRLGFGFSLVLLPGMTAYRGFEQAFLTAIALEVLVGLIMAWQHRGTLRMREAMWLKVCGILGAAAGTAVHGLVSMRIIVVGAMSIIALTCALQLIQPQKRRRSRRLLAAAGVTSGALNSWTSLSGPPVVMYYLATEGSDDDVVKGSLSGYFVLLYIVTFVLLLVNGTYAGFTNGWALLAGAATILVGRTSARRIGDRVPGSLTTVSLTVLTVAALATAIATLA
jgi:uncharacterized membrane protein YfcA